jgi:hypothetical protein
MRADEEYTKKAIERYLSKLLSEFTISEGEDPPDYYVNFDTKKIPLEITRCEPIYALKNKIENRKTVDGSLLSLCDEFNNKFKSQIPNGVSLLLHIECPVDKNKWRDFKKEVCREIVQLIEANIYNKWNIFNIAGKKVRIKKIRHDQEWRKKIIGLVHTMGDIPIIQCDIQLQTQLLLDKILEEKETKTKIINGQEWKCEKWLGILNNYFLADLDNFLLAINSLKIRHTFTRIFCVNSIGNVSEIFSNSTG